MTSQPASVERMFSAVLGLTGWSAVILQCHWAIDTGLANGLSLSMTTANVLSYFTILTNVLIAGYLTLTAAGRAIGSSGTKTALASYILIVGFVYEAALRRLWTPEGLHLLVDIVLHYLVPLSYFTYWILFVPKRLLRYQMVAGWTIYPFAYLLYTLLRAKLYGFFPYPFLNYEDLGWARFFFNVSVLILLFVATGILLVALGRLLARSPAD